MIPSKSHLQIIVKELEKFESQLEKSYNFVEFLDRARTIFNPEQQQELNQKINSFKYLHMIDPLTAQNLLYKARVLKMGGKYVLRLKYEDKPYEKVPINLNSLEYSLRGLVVWCRKQIIKIIKDERVEFDRMTDLDLKKGY